MRRYRRIGVFLTGSPADDTALGFAGRCAELAESEKVLCVYVHGGGPEVSAPEIVDVEELRKRVTDALPGSVAGIIDVEVHAGGGIAEILRSARDLELDLIVKGRRLPAHQAAVGSAFTKLARLNKADPDPHPLEVFLFHSHPPIVERLATADEFAPG